MLKDAAVFRAMPLAHMVHNCLVRGYLQERRRHNHGENFPRRRLRRLNPGRPLRSGHKG